MVAAFYRIGQTLGLLAVALLSQASSLAKPALSGESIYANQCTKCHGDKGQGVANEYDEPLIGDWPVEKLTRVITRTMPEDDPKKCVGDDAELVARYIFDAFYSPAAQARNNPPRIELARLTNRQFLHSVADLIGSFTGRPEIGQTGVSRPATTTAATTAGTSTRSSARMLTLISSSAPARRPRTTRNTSRRNSRCAGPAR